MAKVTTIKQAYGRAMLIIATFSIAGGLLVLNGLAASAPRTDQAGSVPISELEFDESNRVEIPLKRGLHYCVPEPIELLANGRLIISDETPAQYNCYKAVASGRTDVLFENVNSSSKHSLIIK